MPLNVLVVDLLGVFIQVFLTNLLVLKVISAFVYKDTWIALPIIGEIKMWKHSKALACIGIIYYLCILMNVLCEPTNLLFGIAYYHLNGVSFILLTLYLWWLIQPHPETIYQKQRRKYESERPKQIIATRWV
jgi:hypothetical protein